MIKIRKAKKEDLTLLNKHLSVKIPEFHESHLKEQETGKSIWLIAWICKKPVGHIQLRFDGCKVKKVRDNLKNCSHIESLGVKEEYRRKGIATKLINFTENLSRKKGYKKIGLSVEKDNNFLKNLYERRGYKDWRKGIIIEKWNELDKKGKKKLIKEKCNYYVKELK